MIKYIIAITIFLSIILDSSKDVMFDINLMDIEIPTAEAEISEISDSETQEPMYDAVEVRIPHWITYEMPQGIIYEFIYSKCEYKYFVEGDKYNTYYVNVDEYSTRLENINFPDFALITQVYPEDFTMVESIVIDENGDSIDIVINDIAFFKSIERSSVERLAYQCAMSKCMFGIEYDDINIQLNYTIKNNNPISYSLPYRARSIVDNTDDMHQEFNIHIPLEYTMGDSEQTKQMLLSAGIEDIVINKDSTLDYTATKELILDMEDDYYSMMEDIHKDIVNQTSYITDLYYDDLKTYIIIEINSGVYDVDHLFSLMNFISFNNQFCQLFSGVKPEDIQFKILVIDNQNGTPIAELSYPQYGE